MSSSKLQDNIIQLKLDDLNVLIKQERSHIQLSSQHLSRFFKKPREGLTTLEEICIGNEIKIMFIPFEKLMICVKRSKF